MRHQKFTVIGTAAFLSFSVSTTAYAQSFAVGTPDYAQSASAPAPVQVPLASQQSTAPSYSIPTPALVQSEWRHRQATALKWEIGYLTLSAIDAAETIHCLDRGVCDEGNPIFGKHPSAEKLILAKVLLGGLHFAVFSHANSRNPKTALRFAQISCGIQGTVVLLNARIAFR